VASRERHRQEKVINDISNQWLINPEQAPDGPASAQIRSFAKSSDFRGSGRSATSNLKSAATKRIASPPWNLVSVHAVWKLR
jgi:hypothetical protein